jgi:hypothetical protein
MTWLLALERWITTDISCLEARTMLDNYLDGAV